VRRRGKWVKNAVVMKCFSATFVVLAAATRLATAEIPDTYLPALTNSTSATNPPGAVATRPPVAASKNDAAESGASTAKPSSSKTAKTARPATVTAQALMQMQGSLDQLTKSNHDLLDLLKQQQQVLQDIQYDRRLQSHQIENLEERLEEALTEKQQLEAKVDSLESQAAVRPAAGTTAVAPAPTPAPNTPPAPAPSPNSPANPPPSAPVVSNVPAPDNNPPPQDTTPPPPASYLPPEGADNPPGQGQPMWHRIVALKGTDNQQTDVFTVHGKLWRVLWHNQDKAGKLYANTSALFINAFPRDDTIPSKVCSKLGTGGDSAQMQGPGNYYLKIEASGGSWELAVEDFY
jgi:hypothetical protein